MADESQEPKILYGVWIPGIGWLKANSEPLATEIEEVAASTAARIGNGATVEFISEGLAELENQLLEAERQQKKETEQRRILRRIWKIFNREKVEDV